MLKLGILSDFQALTLDVIGQCAFALKVQCQTNEKDPFLMYVQEAFRLFDIKNFPLVAISGEYSYHYIINCSFSLITLSVISSNFP